MMRTGCQSCFGGWRWCPAVCRFGGQAHPAVVIRGQGRWARTPSIRIDTMHGEPARLGLVLRRNAARNNARRVGLVRTACDGWLAGLAGWMDWCTLRQHICRISPSRVDGRLSEKKRKEKHRRRRALYLGRYMHRRVLHTYVHTHIHTRTALRGVEYIIQRTARRRSVRRWLRYVTSTRRPLRMLHWRCSPVGQSDLNAPTVPSNRSGIYSSTSAGNPPPSPPISERN